MEIRFGQEVETQDGQQVGQVASTLVDRDSHELSHAVVTSRGEHYLVSLSLVEGGVGQRLVLYADVAQFERLPHTHPGGLRLGESTVARAGDEEFVAAEPAERIERLRQAIQVKAGVVELSEATLVDLQGETVGHLVAVAGDEYTNRLQFLQVRLDTNGQVVRLPLQGLEDLRDDRARFGVTLEDAMRLTNPPAGGYISDQVHWSDLQKRPEEEKGGPGQPPAV